MQESNMERAILGYRLKCIGKLIVLGQHNSQAEGIILLFHTQVRTQTLVSGSEDNVFEVFLSVKFT